MKPKEEQSLISAGDKKRGAAFNMDIVWGVAITPEYMVPIDENPWLEIEKGVYWQIADEKK